MTNEYKDDNVDKQEGELINSKENDKEDVLINDGKSDIIDDIYTNDKYKDKVFRKLFNSK